MKKNILNGRFLIVLLAFAIFTFCSVSTYAQPKFGINSITTVTPPYPITLDGYVAEGGTKISLQILPTDITLSQYPVLLKLVIKGNGITLESKSLTIHEPVYLNGNEFLTLNGSDLEAFFNPDNLNFSGYSKTQYQRNGRLPEGVYTVGFELYDVIRKIPVASVRSTIVFLFLNEVPALTLPMNEQMISAAGTQTVNFRWTTRHSPLAATFFTPEYLFELWEITPAGRNPYDIVKGTRPLYATTLSSPYLAYGIAEPQLQPGKSYAWRVRESDPENRTLFKNNGYTEVYTFTYGRNCPVPELSADKVGTSHLSVNWKADINEKEFELRYREKKKKNAEWYSQSTNLLSGKVDNLKQNTVYEVEVCAVCGDQRSEYSNRLEINTRQNTSFKCGQIDSSRIPQNKNPLRKLSSGDIFNAYGFDVQVKEVTGGTGAFTGKGYVLVPVLNFIKVEVKFDNIQLNEEYQLIGGEVRTVYNLKNTIGSKFEKGGVIDDLTKLITGDEEKNKFDDMADKTIEVDSVKEIKLENGKVVITDVNGKTEEVSTTSNKIIAVKTEEGKEYVVDTSSGTIYSSGNSGQKAPVGSPSGSVTTAAQAGKGSTPKYSVSFLPHQLQECGFDYPSGKSPAANYEQVEITGKPTLVPWKSTQAGRIERVVAEIAGGPADSVRYYRESNNVVMTAPGIKANQQQIMLNGLGKNEEDKLYAWYAAYNQGDTNKTYARVLAGQLNTVSYEKKAIKVVLVPVNNSSCPRADYVQSELNKIYKSAVVEWVVLNGENITVPLAGGENAVFDNTDKDANMNYTPDMKAAINVFSSNPQYNRETYYLFFLDNAKDPSIKGYMPLKKQFGFIFKYNQYPDEYLRTIAHELGHGPFRLYHTFSDKNKYQQPEGSTDNLMDYAAASATNLNKYQWDWVHDPEWRVYWGEEEGEAEAPALNLTYADNVYRFIEIFRCSYVKKEAFDFYSFVMAPSDMATKFNLGTNEFTINLSVYSRLTSFEPKKTEALEENGYWKYKLNNNITLSVKGDKKSFENYLFPENISNNSGGVRTLIALNRIDDACKLIFKSSKCILADIPYSDIWKVIEPLSKETYLEDYKDYSLLELLKIVANDQSMSISLYSEFTKNENLVLNLYQGIDDENTKGIFINLLLKIHSNYYKGKTINIPKEKHYVSWTECQRNGTRINIRVIDYSLGHYTQSQVFSLLEPIAYVIPGKKLNEEDIIFYPPALFILHQFEVSSAQGLKEFLTGAVQLAGVFSSAGVLLKGAGIIQKTIAAAEIANAAINLTLQSKAVQEKIRSLEGGEEFLRKWPTISTFVDVISIGNAVSSLFIKGGRNTLKELDNTLSDIEKTRIKNVLDECERVVAKTGNVIDDAILDAAKAFDDNILDVADVGFQNWKTFQNRVALQSKIRYPNSKIGNQITLDITYVKNGQTYTKTIIPDNLVQIEVNGVKKYKLIDAKTSVKNDLTQIDDLTGTCTQNQQPIYKIIDGESGAGTITKVEMRGGQAEQAFGISSKTEIQLELGVEFWVNSSKTDFTQYLIRSRIK